MFYVCAQLQLGGDAGRDYTNCKKAQEPKKGKELKINENYKKAKKKKRKKNRLRGTVGQSCTWGAVILFINWRVRHAFLFSIF